MIQYQTQSYLTLISTVNVKLCHSMSYLMSHSSIVAEISAQNQKTSINPSQCCRLALWTSLLDSCNCFLRESIWPTEYRTSFHFKAAWRHLWVRTRGILLNPESPSGWAAKKLRHQRCYLRLQSISSISSNKRNNWIMCVRPFNMVQDE